MNTCKTCKFKGSIIWGAPSAEMDDAETGFFICIRIKSVCEQSDAEIIRDGDIEKAYVQGETGYGSGLCVSDDFGCNEWQPK